VIVASAGLVRMCMLVRGILSSALAGNPPY